MAKVDLKNLDRYLEQEQFEETHRKVQAKKKKDYSIDNLDNKHLSK